MSDNHPHHPNPDWRSARRIQMADGEEIGIADLQGEQAKGWELELSDRNYREGLRRAHELGLPPADSIVDKDEISTFVRNDSLRFAGIQTFLKMPYLEDINLLNQHEVAVVGVPFDTGTTYRPGPRHARKNRPGRA